MNTGRASMILLGKELRVEWRSRELLNTTFVFALMVLVLFSFAFDFTAAESRLFGPGLLWIAFLFGGSLMLHPSFAREQANDTIDALRTAPVSPFAIVLGKTLANFLFLLLVEVVMLPVFAFLYNAQARMREMLLPLLLLVFVTPLLLAAVEATRGLLNDPPELSRAWTQILVIFDVVFLTASWLLCEHLIEE
jgi:heme exporter protein B